MASTEKQTNTEWAWIRPITSKTVQKLENETDQVCDHWRSQLEILNSLEKAFLASNKEMAHKNMREYIAKYNIIEKFADDIQQRTLELTNFVASHSGTAHSRIAAHQLTRLNDLLIEKPPLHSIAEEHLLGFIDRSESSISPSEASETLRPCKSRQTRDSKDRKKSPQATPSQPWKGGGTFDPNLAKCSQKDLEKRISARRKKVKPIYCWEIDGNTSADTVEASTRDPPPSIPPRFSVHGEDMPRHSRSQDQGVAFGRKIPPKPQYRLEPWNESYSPNRSQMSLQSQQRINPQAIGVFRIKLTSEEYDQLAVRRATRIAEKMRSLPSSLMSPRVQHSNDQFGQSQTRQSHSQLKELNIIHSHKGTNITRNTEEELAKLSEEASQMIVEALSSRQDLINKLDSENSLMQQEIQEYRSALEVMARLLKQHRAQKEAESAHEARSQSDSENGTHVVDYLKNELEGERETNSALRQENVELKERIEVLVQRLQTWVQEQEVGHEEETKAIEELRQENEGLRELLRITEASQNALAMASASSDPNQSSESEDEVVKGKTKRIEDSDDEGMTPRLDVQEGITSQKTEVLPPKINGNPNILNGVEFHEPSSKTQCLLVLRAEDGPYIGEVFTVPLDEETPQCFLGRSRAKRATDLSLSQDGAISNSHIKLELLEYNPSEWILTVTDLKSTNGTKLWEPDQSKFACLREHIPVRLHGKELLEVGTTKLRVEFTILVEPKDALLKVNREMVQVHEIHEKARRDEKPEEILGPVELSPQEADKPHVQQIFETPNKPSAKLNTPKLSSARRMTASTTTRRNAIPELNDLMKNVRMSLPQEVIARALREMEETNT